MCKSVRQGMRSLVQLLVTAAGVAVLMWSSTGALGQRTTEAEFWPATEARVEFSDNWRLGGLVGLRKGDESSYRQLDSAVGFGYRWKRIAKRHLENIDPDKEHTFLLGGGYENLYTLQSGKSPKNENRAILESLSGFRPLSSLLARDRNRIEFRWINGIYSTRYRNNVMLENDVKVHSFQFSPYASAEVFYDSAKNSWNEEQFTAGVQWPFRRLFMLQTYYLRQHCTTSNPHYLNVGGLTLNFYFKNKR